MKLYSKLAMTLYFGTTVLLLGAGAISEFVKEYYPVVKKTIISFIRQMRTINLKSDNRCGGISAV
jgi:hypothetical protein